jgi:hypothetical protein
MSERRRGGSCVYCLQTFPALEDEHVFPDSWYPDGTSPTLARYKVPACKSCNRGYGKVEERLLRGWTMCIDASHPAAAGILPRVLRSMTPAKGRSARDARRRDQTRRKVERSVRIVPASTAKVLAPEGGPRGWTLLPSGLITLNGPAVPIQYSDVHTFVKKLIRGLYFVGTRGPLPLDVEIGTCQVTPSYVAAESSRLKLRRQGIPPGFAFWWGCLETDPSMMRWHFLIWGQVALHGQTRPREGLGSRG